MIRALIGAVLLSSLIATAVVATPALAQEQAATIQATGTGTASAPAASAQLQFLIGASGAFGMESFAMAGATSEGEPGTPVAAMPEAMPAVMSMNPADLTEAQLTPILDALGSAGIESDAIVVTIPVYGGVYGPGGPETADVRVTIEQPQRDGLVDLIASVTDAATANGLSVLYVGARYQAADCAALTQQAREAAISDAMSRVAGLAQGLDAAPGALQQASEIPFFDGSSMGSCAEGGPVISIGSYGPGTEPAFDPDSTEATVTVQVTLTYALAPKA